jgi:hypothetical protein
MKNKSCVRLINSEMEEWVEKFSEQHQRKYWAHKTTGKTSWTNPNPTAEVASTQVVAVASVTNDWVEKFSEQHKRKYWANKVTGKTSWTNPNPTSTSVEISSQVAGEGEWVEKFNEKHKRKYWANKITGKTSWTNPSSESVAVVAVSNEEWVEKYSEQHKRKYWANKTTGKTSWTNPNPTTTASTTTSASGSGGESEWVEKYSEQHKRKYWANKVTGKTSWTNPNPATTAATAATETGGAWTEKFSAKHQRKYWVGPQGATSWTDPHKTSTPASTSAAAPAAASASDSRCQQLETDLEALQRRQSEMQERLDGATRERDECLARVEKMTLSQEGSSEQWATERAELNTRLHEMELRCQELQAECLRLSTERDIYLQLHQEDEKRRDKYDEDRVKLLTHGHREEATSVASSSAEGGTALMDIISLQASHEQYVRKLHAESEIKLLEERARGSKEMSRLQHELLEAGERAQQSQSKSERLEMALGEMREKYSELEHRYGQRCEEADRMRVENERIASDRTDLQRAIELKSEELMRYLTAQHQQKQGEGQSESQSAMSVQMMTSLTNNLLREVQSLLVSAAPVHGGYPDEAPPLEHYLDVVYDDLEPPPDDDLPPPDDDDEPPPDDDEPDLPPPPMDL